ncbi:MAG: hypothetical protein KDA41_09155 [Planctomycetales bacterium]|nr:hypothetical protein [Planctomycetales bacterium]
MSDAAIRARCPACQCNTRHAFLSVPETTPATAAAASLDAGESYTRQRFVCTACEASWEAAILPTDQIRHLCTAAESLVEAKRQLAMQRLIMSKDQIDRLEKANEHTIVLRRAA